MKPKTSSKRTSITRGGDQALSSFEVMNLDIIAANQNGQNASDSAITPTPPIRYTASVFSGPKPNIGKSLSRGRAYSSNTQRKGLISSAGSNVKASASGKLKESAKNLIETEGSLPYRRYNVYVVGEARIGKTSLIKSFLNKKFDARENITQGMQIDDFVANDWKEKRKQPFPDHLEHIVEIDINSQIGGGADNSVITGTSAASTIQDDEMDIVWARMKPQKLPGVKLNFRDFGGQEEFYALHQIFLKDTGCYIIGFSLKDFLSYQARTLAFLKFWLCNKFYYAPTAPTILVGTYADTLKRKKELSKINEVIQKFLGENAFHVKQENDLCFYPMSNKQRKQKNYLKILKARIEREAKNYNIAPTTIPVTFMRFYDHIFNKFKIVSYARGNNTFTNFSEGDFDDCIKFLQDQGLISYFDSFPELQKFIIVDPNWLAQALSFIFNPIGLEDDGVINLIPGFKIFKQKKIISASVMKAIWRHKEYPSRVMNFFIEILTVMKLIVPLTKQDSKSLRYLVPSAYFTLTNAIEVKLPQQGTYFFEIDFSGKYDRYVCECREFGTEEFLMTYLPFGFFERLVCSCITFSQNLPNSRTPRLEGRKVTLGFGSKQTFTVEIIEEKENQEGLNMIRIALLGQTKTVDARALMIRINEMANQVKKDLLRNPKSYLSMCLLVPSLEDPSLKVDYKQLEESEEKYVRPRPNEDITVEKSKFNMWLSPLRSFPAKQRKHVKRKSLYKAFPKGCKYHLFLSHRQFSASQVCFGLFQLLKSYQYRCWLDKQIEDERCFDAFEQGIKDSMIYVLVLSKGIFDSSAVKFEIDTAMRLGKPIIMLQHPDTDKPNNPTFDDYIKKAPRCLESHFNREVLKIEFEAGYQEQFIMRFLDRIEDIEESLP